MFGCIETAKGNKGADSQYLTGNQKTISKCRAFIALFMSFCMFSTPEFRNLPAFAWHKLSLACSRLFDQISKKKYTLTLMQNRLGDLAKKIKEKNLDGFIVTNPVNIFYRTNFRGISPTERESILIITQKSAFLICPKLYQAEALKLKSPKLKIKITDERNRMLDTAKQLLSKAKNVGFEEANLTYSEFKHFKKELIGKKLIAQKNLIEGIRAVKQDEEIRKIEKAQIISQKAFFEIVKTLKVGQREAEIAEKLLKIIKNLGGQGLAFESIIASGKNAAVPHHVTGRKKIKTGEVLLFDFGAKYKDYCADLSRTVLIGKVTDDIKNIYDLVQKAQKQAINKIANGVKAHRIHDHTVNIFKKQNLHDYFLHGLGHGIGLEVHEAPHLRPRHKDKKSEDEILKEGMVFSVEPGLYFPKWGGVRIEDLVTIKGGKTRVLGKLSEGIIEI